MFYENEQKKKQQNKLVPLFGMWGNNMHMIQKVAQQTPIYFERKFHNVH